MTSIRTVDANGNQFWKNEAGEYHRDEDLPAIIYSNSYQAWCQNGRLHRSGGPAAIGADGQAWYQNGKRHRLDGPARIWKNGSVEWWINGIEISNEDIEKWMETNSINPKWEEWSDAEIMSFALRFG